MELRIKFVDFWEGFDINNNFFTQALSRKYKIVISESEPEFLIYSVFGVENLKYEKCIKIFFTGENFVPDFNICDYAIGFDIINFGDRYMRLPLYITYGIEQLAQPKLIIPEKVLNRKFCSFVVSNERYSTKRNRFFHLLSEYKQVDSGGRSENNIGGPVADKMNFIKDYKFNIAFENSMSDGYTTEKIVEPMLVNSLPIYWGNKLVGLDFNPNSFINASDFQSLEELVEYIVQIDSNDEQYLSLLSQPWLNKNSYIDWKDRILAFFDNIYDKSPDNRKYLLPHGHSYIYREDLLNIYTNQQRGRERAERKREKRRKMNPIYWLRKCIKSINKKAL